MSAISPRLRNDEDLLEVLEEEVYVVGGIVDRSVQALEFRISGRGGAGRECRELSEHWRRGGGLTPYSKYSPCLPWKPRFFTKYTKKWIFGVGGTVSQILQPLIQNSSSL